MVTSQAPAPSRASNGFKLAFGPMMLIDLSVFTGTEETRVTRKEFLETPAGDVEVGRSAVRKDTGEVIDSADVVRKAFASNGVAVVLTDDEIADRTMPKGVADIISFVPVKNVGQYLAQDQVQVRPRATKGKVDAAAEKAFALVCATMKANKVVALVKVALRGPAKHGLLFPDGSLVFVRTADQVREPRPMADIKFTPAELKLAGMLVEAIGIDTPTIVDDTAPVVRQYVEDKAQGIPAPVAVEREAIPLDIMAALSASIDAAKAKKGKAA
jgi:non-homologous end joining protein Ku